MCVGEKDGTLKEHYTDQRCVLRRRRLEARRVMAKKSRARHGARTATSVWDELIQQLQEAEETKCQNNIDYWFIGDAFCGCLMLFKASWMCSLTLSSPLTNTETNIHKTIKVTDGTKSKVLTADTGSVFLLILFNLYKLNSLEEVLEVKTSRFPYCVSYLSKINDIVVKHY